MENAKKVFNAWFWAWLGAATVLVVIMTILGKKPANLISSIILFSLMVMPVRNWTYRLCVWGIDYISSISTPFKDRVNPLATYNTLLSPTTRSQNIGFYRVLYGAVWTVCILIALLWVVFNQAAYNVVYGWLHTLEFLITSPFTGKLESRALQLVLYILISIAFLGEIWWLISQIANETWYTNGVFDFGKNWWRFLVMFLGFYFRIILGELLLEFSGEMILSSILFWTIVVVIPLIIILIANHFTRRTSTNGGGTP